MVFTGGLVVLLYNYLFPNKGALGVLGFAIGAFKMVCNAGYWNPSNNKKHDFDGVLRPV